MLLCLLGINFNSNTHFYFCQPKRAKLGLEMLNPWTQHSLKDLTQRYGIQQHKANSPEMMLQTSGFQQYSPPLVFRKVFTWYFQFCAQHTNFGSVRSVLSFRDTALTFMSHIPPALLLGARTLEIQIIISIILKCIILSPSQALTSTYVTLPSLLLNW